MRSTTVRSGAGIGLAGKRTVSGKEVSMATPQVAATIPYGSHTEAINK